MAQLTATAQALTAQQRASGAPPAPSAGLAGAVVTPAAAQARAAQSIQDLGTALDDIHNALAAQSAAHAAALGGPNNLGADPNHPGKTLPDVPNGLGVGALAPAAGIATNATLWQNAKAPTQASVNGQTTVTIDQTAHEAVLTWDSFNVGKHTTVYFDQASGTAKDGTNNWIAMNSIVDPSDVPSQILGSIKAQGTVYLLNQNGIIFGGSSQVNTHSLLASSLPLSGGPIATTGVFSDLGAGSRPGDITVQSGAEISAESDGYALLIAPTLLNSGSIVSNGGQVALIAADQVTLTIEAND